MALQRLELSLARREQQAPGGADAGRGEDGFRGGLELEPGLVAAAVAVIFGPGAELLFIRRSERGGDPWSGHMAFPGGKAEAADLSLRHTAERETEEEVGLELGRHGRFLGRLPSLVTPIRSKGRKHIVHPFVYVLESLPDLRPNAEVAALHWLELERLIRREGRGTMQYPFGEGHVELPTLNFEGNTVWGLTLRMVDDLLTILEAGEGQAPADSARAV